MPEGRNAFSEGGALEEEASTEQEARKPYAMSRWGRVRYGFNTEIQLGMSMITVDSCLPP